MREIKIQIPEYNRHLEFVWEADPKIKAYPQFDALIIQANRDGLVSLARHILLLAQDDVPSGCHFHLDEYNDLEDGSFELIVAKKEDL